MRDASGQNIGLVVYAFKQPPANANVSPVEADYFAKSAALRDELAKKIPKLQGIVRSGQGLTGSSTKETPYESQTSYRLRRTSRGGARFARCTGTQVRGARAQPEGRPGDYRAGNRARSRADAQGSQLNIVGSDIMDEVVLGWVKLYRKQYPRLSVTEDLRASGAGSPGLVSGKGDLAPVAREMFPAEDQGVRRQVRLRADADQGRDRQRRVARQDRVERHPGRQGQSDRLPEPAAARRDLLEDAQARLQGSQDLG